MEKRILLNNAIDAWFLCKKYFEQIAGGNPSFVVQKMFVASLRSASECILRQVCLEQAMRGVIRSMTAHTVAFSELTEKLEELFPLRLDSLPSDQAFEDWRVELKKRLLLLAQVQNNEMHLTDDSNAPLPYHVLLELYQLMKNIEDVLFSEEYGWLMKDHREFSMPETFSIVERYAAYTDLVINGEKNCSIAKHLTATEHDVNDYSLISYPSSLVSFDEFLSRMHVMKQCNLFAIISRLEEERNGQEHIKDEVSRYPQYREKFVFSFVPALLSAVEQANSA